MSDGSYLLEKLKQIAFAVSFVENAVIIRTVTRSLTIHKIPFDKIFKKLPTTNCKNNAALLYGISLLKVKKMYT